MQGGVVSQGDAVNLGQIGQALFIVGTTDVCIIHQFGQGAALGQKVHSLARHLKAEGFDNHTRAKSHGHTACTGAAVVKHVL